MAALPRFRRAAGCSLAFIACLGACLTTPARAAAQPESRAATVLGGATTTQQGAMMVPGATVTILAPESETTVAETVTDAVGRFLFRNLPPGDYVVRASLAGFSDKRIDVTLAAGATVDLAIDLELGAIVETVEVRGRVRASSTPTGGATISGDMLDVLPVFGDTFQAVLPLLPGVQRSPRGRLSMVGGDVSQTGIQLGAVSIADPATGDIGYDVPTDAVEAIDVLTNPYAAEFGRFSAGVTRVETRRGGARWRVTPNQFIPTPNKRRGSWRFAGLQSFSPRVAIGGPLRKDRVFLWQNLQYRFYRTEFEDLPEDWNIRSRGIDAFGRVDVVPSGTHQVYVTGAWFRRRGDFVGLGPFTPPDATRNVREDGFGVGIVDARVIGGSRVLESVVNYQRLDADIFPMTADVMTIDPEGARGGYFNRQDRMSRTAQWVETLAAILKGPAGEHLLKVGIDLLYASYAGHSASQPVLVRRADGTLAWRIDFSGVTSQDQSTEDLAAFVQDRWRPNDRVLVDLGARIDRDGVLKRTNFTPRVGTVLALLPEARAVVRGGIGLFYQRTPLNVAAFESFERRTVTRFATDGTTPAGASIAYAPTVSGRLATPYGLIWNGEFDFRITPRLLIKVNHLRRRANHEFIVDPVEHAAAGRLELSSRGRARYWHTEVTLRYFRGNDLWLNASYVRSKSRSDLNDYDLFFGSERDPLVRLNQYSVASLDVPNRLIVQATVPLPLRFSLAPILEVRDGLPYSLVDEDQRFVGARNAVGRFPRFKVLDLQVERPIHLFGREVFLLLRAYNALDSFTPRDVQENLASRRFGAFLNPIPRRISINFRLALDR